METKRYCVYNKTTESFLSIGATVVDTTLEPLKALQMIVDAEKLNAELSFWLTPFKGIPVTRIFSPFDMVYLDEDYRVVQGIELSPAVELTPFVGKAASALILPLHTVYTSRTYPGDQLIICAADELVRHLARVPVSTSPCPVPSTAPSQIKQGIGTPPVQFGGDAGHAPSQRDDRPAGPQAVTQRQNEKEEVESRIQDVKPEALESQDQEDRLKVRALHQPEIEPPVARVPIPISAAPVTRREVSPISPVREMQPKESLAPPVQEKPVRQFTAGQARDQGGLDASGPGDRTTRKQIAIPRLGKIGEVEFQGPEEKEKVEFHAAEIDSVISQVLRWAEETGRPLARVPDPVAAPTAAQSPVDRSRGNGNPVPARAGDRSERQQAATPRPEEMPELKVREELKAREELKRQEELKAREKDSLKSRFLRWTNGVTRPLVGPSHSKGAARDLKSAGSSLVKHGGSSGSASSSLGSHVRRLQTATEQLTVKGKADKGKAEPPAQRTDSLKTRFVRWLDADSLAPTKLPPAERRRSERHSLPGLVAYYWTGGNPRAHNIIDISGTGFYLQTDERWVPETVIRMTLQKTAAKGEKQEEAIAVLSKVVRWGTDGVGYEFLLSESLDMKSGKIASGKEKVTEALGRFM